MTKIVLASNNEGKLKEFQHLFETANINIVPQKNFQIGSVEETGTTFVENAIIKARYAAEKSGLPAIADDSGLEVDALSGRPGVYSARYISESASAQDRYLGILDELSSISDMSQRSARFQCVLVYMRHHNDPSPIICQASWEGFIQLEPTGTEGHGYDPIFHVPTHQCSAAELPFDEKNKISHRAQALTLLLQQLKTKIS